MNLKSKKSWETAPAMLIVLRNMIFEKRQIKQFFLPRKINLGAVSFCR